MNTPTSISMTWDFAVVIWPVYLVTAIAVFAAMMIWKPAWKKTRVAALALTTLGAPLLLIALAHEASDEVGWFLGKRYFDRLCENYAGEKVYRQVKDVEGFVKLKPRDRRAYERDHLRWGMPDPYGTHAFDIYNSWEKTGRDVDRPPYQFIEAFRYKDREGTTVELIRIDYRFTGEYTTNPNIRTDVKPIYDGVQKKIEQASALYGYTWEERSTSLTRFFWISGGDATVVNTKTREVLARHAGFVFARTEKNQRLDMRPWTNRTQCPGPKGIGIGSFVSSVLIGLQPTTSTLTKGK
jgi:hypothetical protein